MNFKSGILLLISMKVSSLENSTCRLQCQNRSLLLSPLKGFELIWVGMIFLILSIVVNTSIGFIFNYLFKLKLNVFRAIIVNYGLCVLTGGVLYGAFPYRGGGVEAWWPFALGLGFVFIAGFNIVALTVKYFGVTLATIMQKMSLVLSVLVAILLYQEAVTTFKVIGIVLTIAAIWLSNFKADSFKDALSQRIRLFWLFPFLTFFVSGIIEVVLQYVEVHHTSTGNDPGFLVSIFFSAGVLGFLVATVQCWQKKGFFTKRDILGGFILGVPNFFSIYLLLRALGSNLEGSFVFPVHNVGIILLTAGLAFVALRERLTPINWLGVLLAMGAIICLTLG